MEEVDKEISEMKLFVCARVPLEHKPYMAFPSMLHHEMEADSRNS